MNILLLAHFYPPEMGAAAARLHGLARWLVRAGHRVTVVAGYPNYPDGIIPPAYRHRLYAREDLDGVTVLRVPVYASPKRSAVRRLANYSSSTISAALAGILSRGRYDVVLASSPPLFIGLAAWAISRLRRIPFVFDIRDLWPEVAVDAGEFAPDSRMTRLCARLARFLYRRADHIVPVTMLKRAKLAAAGVPESHMSVVSNGVDLDLVTIETNRDVRAEYGLGDRFVLLYAGLLGIVQGVEIVVGAAEILRNRDDIHFLIVGDGARRDALAEDVQRRGLRNVTLLPRQPREAIPAFMAAADACLVPLSSASVDDAVPSKLLEAWGFRRPVILAAAGESARLVHECGAGLVIPPRDGEALATAVTQMAQERDRLPALGRRGRGLVEERFDRRALAAQMEDILQRTISGRGRVGERERVQQTGS